jgi:hypothetical protein
VIQVPEAAFASPAGAADALEASLDRLAATDWAALGTAAHAEMPARLQRAQARFTAVHAAVLAAFTAQGGYEPGGHRSARAWLTGKAGVSRGRRAPRSAGAGGWPGTGGSLR